MKKARIWWVMVMARSALACASNDPVSIGEDEVWTGESLRDFGASWDGYVEGVSFPSGSDRVRLVLDNDGDGYLEIGDVPLVDPPVRADAPFPDDPNYRQVFPFGERDPFLHEGFHYTVRAANVADHRIRLSIAAWEFYEQWCNLQTPYANQDPTAYPPYSCAPPTASAGMVDGQCFAGNPHDPATRIAISCTHFHYCYGFDMPCTCSADGCVSTDNTTLTLDAKLVEQGKELTGTLIWTANHAVHLTRN